LNEIAAPGQLNRWAASPCIGDSDETARLLFAVLLPRAIPKEVLTLLAGYLRDDIPEGSPYVACSEVAVHSPFVHLTVLKSDDSGKVWRVRLPTQYVLAITEWLDEDARSIGFLERKNL